MGSGDLPRKKLTPKNSGIKQTTGVREDLNPLNVKRRRTQSLRQPRRQNAHSGIDRECVGFSPNFGKM